MGAERTILRETSHAVAPVDNPTVHRTVDAAGSRLTASLRREMIAVLFLIPLGILLFGTADRLVIGAFNDDGVYVALGKAIADGAGYRSIHIPGGPIHSKYPPALPAILALFWWIGGSLSTVVALARAANLVVIGGAAALSWWYGRAVLKLSALPLALFGLGPFFLEAALHYNSLILSEPYFLLGWLAVLLVYSRLAPAPSERERTRVAGVLGLLLASISLFRTQGVVLIAAVLALLALERRGTRVWLACAAGSTAPLIAWLAFRRRLLAQGPVSTHPNELSYFEWIRAQGDDGPLVTAFAAVGRNTLEYVRTFSHYASGSAWIGTSLVLAFAAAVIIGLWRTRRRETALVGTILPSVGVVLCWPFAQDRLILGVLPVLGLAAAAAADAGWRALSVRGRWIARIACILLVGGLTVRQVELRTEALHSVVAARPPSGFSPSFIGLVNSRYIEKVSRWLVTHAQPTDRVLTETPAGVFLHTGLPAVGSMVAGDHIAQQAFPRPGTFLAERILEDGITIVTVANLSLPIARDVAALMEQCPDVLAYAGGLDGEAIPAIFRVVPNEQCLRDRFLGP